MKEETSQENLTALLLEAHLRRSVERISMYQVTAEAEGLYTSGVYADSGP